MKEVLGEIVDAIRDFLDGIGPRKLTTFSAACAYYLFMSLVPLMMLIVSAIQYTPLTEELVMNTIVEYIPDSLYQIIESIISGIYRGGGVALTVSIVLTIWSASASMKALMRGMDSVYDTPREENYFKFSLRAIIYMFILMIMIILSFVVMVLGGRILELIEQHFPQEGTAAFLLYLLKYLRYVIVMLILFAVFMQLYRWMPAKNGRYRNQLPGAAFSAFAWVVFSGVFSLYLSLSDKFGAYGYIGTVMVAMLWLFYCFYILLLGGYINHYIDMRRDSKRELGA